MTEETKNENAINEGIFDEGKTLKENFLQGILTKNLSTKERKEIFTRRKFLPGKKIFPTTKGEEILFPLSFRFLPRDLIQERKEILTRRKFSPRKKIFPMTKGEEMLFPLSFRFLPRDLILFRLIFLDLLR